MEKYKTYLQDNYKSINTITGYLKIAQEYTKLFPTLSIENIDKYIANLKSIGRSSSTINQKMSGLRRYNQYLLDNELIDRMYVLKKHFIKIQQRNVSPTRLTHNRIKNIIDKARDNDSLRNYTIINTLAGTGMRREELVNMKKDHINRDTRELTIIGKGNKERVIFISKNLIDLVDEYLSTVKKYDSEYVFSSRQSGQLTLATINNVLKKYNVTPHELRHFRATYLLNNGFDIKEVQEILGHVNINTTSIYLHPSAKEMSKKINKLEI